MTLTQQARRDLRDYLIVGAICIILSIDFAAAASSQAPEPGYAVAGQGLYSSCRSDDAQIRTQCQAYLMGIADMMANMGVYLAALKPEIVGPIRPDLLKISICNAGNYGPKRVSDTLISWRGRHPEYSGSSDSTLAILSLREAWPCH
jgi:hypothetical protein